MGKIEITGLKVTACHGVLPSEKQNPQPFVFDIIMECDLGEAAKNDDLAATVNYAEVCACVYDFCINNGFNLIERLAYGAAFMLAERYPRIDSVKVTVHKPQAPVGLPFGDVTVSAEVERNKVVLSLGSSMGDKRAALEGVIKKLSAVRGIKVLKVSDFIETEPYGNVAVNKFLNCALLAECLLSPRALLNELHRVEEELGRERKERWGDRTADADIVFFGNKIIAEEGLCIPHPDYMNRPFVIEPLKQIVPQFVCPLTHKRVSDM